MYIDKSLNMQANSLDFNYSTFVRQELFSEEMLPLLTILRPF